MPQEALGGRIPELSLEIKQELDGGKKKNIKSVLTRQGSSIPKLGCWELQEIPRVRSSTCSWLGSASPAGPAPLLGQGKPSPKFKKKKKENLQK